MKKMGKKQLFHCITTEEFVLWIKLGTLSPFMSDRQNWALIRHQGFYSFSSVCFCKKNCFELTFILIILLTFFIVHTFVQILLYGCLDLHDGMGSAHITHVREFLTFLHSFCYSLEAFSVEGLKRLLSKQVLINWENWKEESVGMWVLKYKRGNRK